MTILLVVEAVKRLFYPEVVDGRAMFTISVIGLGMNFVLMGVLGHNHGHGEPPEP
jgi:zinc transporter 2